MPKLLHWDSLRGGDRTMEHHVQSHVKQLGQSCHSVQNSFCFHMEVWISLPENGYDITEHAGNPGKLNMFDFFLVLLLPCLPRVMSPQLDHCSRPVGHWELEIIGMRRRLLASDGPRHTQSDMDSYHRAWSLPHDPRATRLSTFSEAGREFCFPF